MTPDPRPEPDAFDAALRAGLRNAEAAAAALAWRATGGPAWLAADYPAPDAWRAEDHMTGEAIT